jgi:tetratricopeptide (TPR) repeat protein
MEILFMLVCYCRPEAETRRPTGTMIRAGRTARRGGVAVVLGLALALAPAVKGDDIPPGTRVVQKGVDFELRVGKEIVDRHAVIDIYEVERANGPWLWLNGERSGLKGWARADSVVPLDDAIAHFTRRIQASPNDPVPYAIRARAWELKDEPDIALGDLNDAIRLDPTHAWVYNWRGIIWKEKQAYAKAVADYTEALRLDPRYTFAYVNRGLAEIELNEFDKAIEDFNEAIRLDPGNARNYDHRGLAWHGKGDQERAIRDFTEALKLDPKLADAYINRGLAWFALKDYDKAIEDYNHAVELDPDDPLVYNDRGWAFEGKRDHDRAISDFDKALQLDPKFVRAYTNRGIALAAKRDFNRAIEDYDRALGIDPNRARPYTHRAIALAASGDYEGAIADYNRALELDPRSSWTRYNRLVAYLNAGRVMAFGEARRFLDEYGWHNELAIHASLIGHFAALREGNPLEARRFLDDAAEHGDSNAWTYQLVRFFRGGIGEKELLAMGSDDARKTEIHAFLGLRDSTSGHPEAALPHFRWVKEHGSPTNAEYRIALAEIDRIEDAGRNHTSMRPPYENSRRNYRFPGGRTSSLGG